MSSLQFAQEKTAAFIRAGCRFLAMLGGLVLVAIAVTTVVSVLGRYFFNSPISGDFEIVEVGCAIAVALFLPYCQLKDGNVIVDVLTGGLPPGIKRLLDALGCLLLALVAALLAWRMFEGAADLKRYNDESMVLHLKTWWGFVVIVPALALLCATGIMTAWSALTGEALHKSNPDLPKLPEDN